MKVKLILPALLEAESPAWRPIKYSLFPPLGLATLASFLDPNDEATLVDQHVESLVLDDEPDLVVIQVYITNAYRAYRIADHYRARGVHVALGGLHVTSMPEEAAAHADTIFLGPGEQTFPDFLSDFRRGRPRRLYRSTTRTLVGVPPIRRDLIRRDLYLVPNSIVVSRGCPFHCSFCYKDAFFTGGRGFYTQAVDDALAGIERLPGRHLYFLDDHLLGHRRFAGELFEGMRGMGRLFQGAATVDSILRGDLIERAADAGLRSLFVGFESLNEDNHRLTGKVQNLGRDAERVVRRLDDLGIMINASFVFGLDGDGPDVFDRTVDWAVGQGVTTSTFHIATPYPGTAFHNEMKSAGRICSWNWDRYDTRHVVFEPRGMDAAILVDGYHRAYRDFYSWSNITRASRQHRSARHRVKHFCYSAGWKKFEPLWDTVIRIRRLASMTPLLEGVLSRVSRGSGSSVAPDGMDGEGGTDRDTEVCRLPPVAKLIVFQRPVVAAPMIDWFSLASTGLAFFVVAVSPGPATLSNATIAMKYGRRTSLVYGAGLSSGLVFWGLIAASGMGAVLQSSLFLLMMLKVLGGVYLLWLAVQSARAAWRTEARTVVESRNSSWFARGLLLNMSNPKSVIAYMAALSVGINPDDGVIVVVAATVVCIVVGFLTNALYSMLFSIGGLMRGYLRLRRWIDGTVGVLFSLAGFGLIRSAFAR